MQSPEPSVRHKHFTRPRAAQAFPSASTLDDVGLSLRCCPCGATLSNPRLQQISCLQQQVPNHGVRRAPVRWPKLASASQSKGGHGSSPDLLWSARSRCSGLGMFCACLVSLSICVSSALPASDRNTGEWADLFQRCATCSARSSGHTLPLLVLTHWISAAATSDRTDRGAPRR